MGYLGPVFPFFALACLYSKLLSKGETGLLLPDSSCCLIANPALYHANVESMFQPHQWSRTYLQN